MYQQKGLKYHFPERNRLISGLSREFYHRIHCEKWDKYNERLRVDQNREVYVLPGSIYNPMTQGNLVSAQEGAKIVLKAYDILEDYSQSL